MAPVSRFRPVWWAVYAAMSGRPPAEHPASPKRLAWQGASRCPGRCAAVNRAGQKMNYRVTGIACPNRQPGVTTAATSYITGSNREHIAAIARLRSRISGVRSIAWKSSRRTQRE